MSLCNMTFLGYSPVIRVPGPLVAVRPLPGPGVGLPRVPGPRTQSPSPDLNVPGNLKTVLVGLFIISDCENSHIFYLRFFSFPLARLPLIRVRRVPHPVYGMARPTLQHVKTTVRPDDWSSDSSCEGFRKNPFITSSDEPNSSSSSPSSSSSSPSPMSPEMKSPTPSPAQSMKSP